jgi:hypothetical protein
MRGTAPLIQRPQHGPAWEGGAEVCPRRRPLYALRRGNHSPCIHVSLAGAGHFLGVSRRGTPAVRCANAFPPASTPVAPLQSQHSGRCAHRRAGPQRQETSPAHCVAGGSVSPRLTHAPLPPPSLPGGDSESRESIVSWRDQSVMKIMRRSPRRSVSSKNSNRSCRATVRLIHTDLPPDVLGYLIKINHLSCFMPYGVGM